MKAGHLDLVRDFVNTADLETGADAIGNPQGLSEWLAERGLAVDGPVAGADVERAHAVREALRALLAANNGAEPDPEAAATLDAAARRAGVALRFLPDGTARNEPSADGVDGALGGLLAIVAAAMVEGTWSRLKACRSESCRWAFYDGARNRSRTWCSMAACGNRVKARAYRRRRGAGA